MNKHLATGLLALLTSATALNAAVVFTTGTTTYDESDVIYVDSTGLTNQRFLRDTSVNDDRMALQTFQVTSNISISGINLITSAIIGGAEVTFRLVDLGTSLPTETASGDFFRTSIPTTSLASETKTFTAVSSQSTVAWSFTSVNLSTTNYYALLIDPERLSDSSINFQWMYNGPATSEAESAYTGGTGYYVHDSGKLLREFNNGDDFNDFSLALVAVPEPSTTALLLGFVALGGVLLRRKLRDQ